MTSASSAAAGAVLLLESAGGYLAAALATDHSSVLACHTVEQAYALYDARMPPLAVLSGSLDDGLAVAVRMRMRDPGIGIVILTDFLSAQVRTHALLCGADACLPRTVELAELRAVLKALERRRPAGAGAGDAAPPRVFAGPPSTPPRWELLSQGWTLAAPNGVRLTLGAQERALLLRLWSVPNREVSRAELMTALAEVEGARLQGRAVDIVVSRLRRKGRRAGVDLPLRSLYGYGYAFAA